VWFQREQNKEELPTGGGAKPPTRRDAKGQGLGGVGPSDTAVEATVRSPGRVGVTGEAAGLRAADDAESAVDACAEVVRMAGSTGCSHGVLEDGSFRWSVDDRVLGACVAVSATGRHGQLMLVRELVVPVAVDGAPGWGQVLECARGFPRSAEGELLGVLAIVLGGEDNGLGESVAGGGLEVWTAVIHTLIVVEERGLGCGFDVAVSDDPAGEGDGDEKTGGGERGQAWLAIECKHEFPFACCKARPHLLVSEDRGRWGTSGWR
jgi:hypothetical protein